MTVTCIAPLVDIAPTRQYGDQAADLARQLGDDVLLGRNLMIYLMSGDLIELAQSAPLLAEAIACSERSGDQLLRSYLHNNAAVHALRAGEVPAAPRLAPPPTACARQARRPWLDASPSEFPFTFLRQ